MAEVTEMMTGVRTFVWTPLYAGFIVALLAGLGAVVVGGILFFLPKRN